MMPIMRKASLTLIITLARVGKNKHYGYYMKLIYGLGNPGEKYATTRHNIGFMVIDRLSQKLDIPINRNRFNVAYGHGEFEGEEIVLAKPQTFMNSSGEPLKFLPLDPDDLIVIVDDMDIPFGQLRIRGQGSAGGHNGLKSIIANLETKKFTRIRMGIGRPVESCEVIDYVLSSYKENEMNLLEEQLALAVEALLSCITDGVPKAMNAFNQRQK